MITSETARPRILFVDDDAAILKSLRRLTRRYDWHCQFVNSGEAALALLQEQKFDAVVTDMHMPHMSGTSLLQHCREYDPNIICILLTGCSDKDLLMGETDVTKIHHTVTKPWDNKQLSELLENAIQQRNTIQSPLGNKRQQKIAPGNFPDSTQPAV